MISPVALSLPLSLFHCLPVVLHLRPGIITFADATSLVLTEGACEQKHRIRVALMSVFCESLRTGKQLNKEILFIAQEEDAFSRVSFFTFLSPARTKCSG